MAKIVACLFVCFAAVQLGSCQPITDDEKLVFISKVGPVLEGCAKENSVALADIDFAKATREIDGLNPCFVGCVFKKVGVVTPDGLIDVATAVSKIQSLVHDPADKAMYEQGGVKCASVNDQAVSDGNAGCERGMIFLKCIKAENIKLPL